MQEIKILKTNVYELIAAGEVVTGPCSVVKELVENSIDANASFISVEIKNGGKSLIRVIDNGDGIKNNQCKKAFLNHATSKILNEEDLDKINSLGFRGEALFSIAAVSKVLIITKTKEEKLGARYMIEGSKEKKYDLVESSVGTTIEIRDIFYNIPARLKFLKNENKEASLVQDIIEKLALSHTNISFEFKKDGKTIMQTFKSSNKKDVIYNIYGKEIYDSLIPIDFKNENIKITGFISNPTSCKSYRYIQYVFVNTRYVKFKSFNAAVENSFKGSIKTGQFPYFIIYISVPLNEVDVNIHPSKIEVRFVKEKEILNSISFAVREAIFKYNNNFLFEKTLNNDKFEKSYKFESDIIKYNNNQKQNQKQNNEEFKDFKFLSTANIKTIKSKKNINREAKLSDTAKEMINSIVYEDDVNQNNVQNNVIDKKMNQVDENNDILKYENNNENNNKEENLKFNISQFRIIGELFKLYILIEFEDNLIIIDKHAAHEKILYEKLKNENNSNLKRQILLLPIKISLKSNDECEMVLKNYNLFLKFGFLIEHFEGNLVLIREIPAILSNENCKDIFENIVYNIKNNKNNLTMEKLDEIYSMIACKGAIKANEINTKQELEKLVEKVIFNPNIRNCPHGRPAILLIKKERVDKKFGRK